jgi:hypothetical protein
MAVVAKKKPVSNEGYRFKYGAKWKPMVDTNDRPLRGPDGKIVPMPDWMIEREMLTSETKPPGDLGRYEHFKRFVTCIWGDPDGIWYFEWNSNAEEILRKYIEYKILAVAGHASSGKTEALACIGVAEFLLDPFNTKVIFTAKTKASSKGKIWGSVAECWQQACRFFGGEGNMPGKLLKSQTIIRYDHQGVTTDKSGLELVAGESSAAAESAEKLQGYKRGKILLMGDEFATLDPSILETAKTNLFANPGFRMIAGFNPNSYFDPGGLVSEPETGWSSITEHSTGWPTKLGGWCVRFDGEKSPNVLACRKIWRGLLDLEGLEAIKKVNPERTKGYWMMARGFWCPTGAAEGLFAEADFMLYRAMETCTTWEGQWKLVCGLDLGFAHGGDRVIATLGRVGRARLLETGKSHVVCERVETVDLNEDIMDKSVSKSVQIARLFKKLVQKWGVRNEDIDIDATGGGDPFAALLATEIGSGFGLVQFGAKPSDMPISSTDKRKGTDRFKNKMSELWGVGPSLLRSQQLKGLDPDTITELCSRLCEEGGDKLLIESKDDMKKRIQRSPDRGDSYFLMLNVARRRHGLSSSETSASKPPLPKTPVHSYFTPKPEALWDNGPSLRNDGLTWGN